MGAYTPRAGLYKPGGGSTGLILPDETVDIDKLNANFDKIDALLGARNVPSAASYGGNMDGDIVYAQDTEFLYMYSAAGGNLITPRLPGSTRFTGTQAEMTAFKPRAHDGDLWFNTTDKLEYLFLSGDWVGGEGVLVPGASVTFTYSKLRKVEYGFAELTLNANRSSGGFVSASLVATLPAAFFPSGIWADLLTTTLNVPPLTATLRLDPAGAVTTIGIPTGQTTANIRGTIKYPLATP